MKTKASMTFHQDDYPNQPKILFIGNGGSSHTHSWIDLLQDAPINVRLFSMAGIPPQDWAVKTYLATPVVDSQPSKTRKLLTPFSDKLPPFGASAYFKLSNPQAWLAKVIQNWQPDIIHTLGLDSGGRFYLEALRNYDITWKAQWVAQIRGGPDLALHRLMPEHQENIRQILQSCDQVIADNEPNYTYSLEFGIPENKLSSLGVMPGTGGVFFDEDKLQNISNPSQKPKNIVWTKAYECPQSKALPILEAIKIAWDKIKPCKIYMLAVVQDEVRMWFKTLPEEIQKSIIMKERIPRQEVFAIFEDSRILLAPSISDGIPNVLYEAMASKTFPIVSPIETIKTVVEDEKNVLFARNLYPQEIADALIRAMSDDTLIDQAAQTNLYLVREIANRETIRAKVLTYYQDLVSEKV